MQRLDKLKWYKKEFKIIHNEIKNKSFLSYSDFLRIRNFKLQNFTVETEKNIKEITSKAFKLAENDKIKDSIEKLTELNGVAIPTASTILAMKFPDKYAIIDKRVIKQLKKYEWLKDYSKNPETYEKYILLLKKIKPSKISLRDFERNLFEGNSVKFKR